MAFEEINGLKINPTKLKEQCTLISQNYDYQNTLYTLLANRVVGLYEEDRLKGNAIKGFKFQLSNYVSVFEALNYANELDKYDIHILTSILDAELGNDILDGTEILEKITQAQEDYENYLWKRNDWYSQYMNAKWQEIVYLDMCYYTYKCYEKLAEDALEDKEYWESRGKLLLSISAQLSGLFVKGNEFRDCANEGMNQIMIAYDTNTNAYMEGDTSWKDKLHRMVCDCMYTETGEVNWGLIEQILSKDGDAISDSEYKLAAYAYMNAGIEKLNDFFMMCTVPGEVGTLYLDEKIDNLFLINKDMVMLDEKKIEGICRQANVYQTNLLALIRYGEVDEASKDALIVQRDDIVQKITLAQTLNQIHAFYGTKGEKDYFVFETSYEGLGKDECIKVTYQSLISDNQQSIATLEPQVITVTNTLTKSGLSGYSTRVLNDAYLKELTSYSTAIVGSNVTNEVVGNVLGGIPGGGFAIFGLGLVKDIYENERTYYFINEAYTTEIITDTAAYFDCCGNIVLYEDNKVGISIYESEHTNEIIERVRVLMNNPKLDAKYLLEHTGDVFMECYEYMEENGDKEFNKAVEGD